MWFYGENQVPKHHTAPPGKPIDTRLYGLFNTGCRFSATAMEGSQIMQVKRRCEI
jgi:hypothetical protein